MILLLGGTSETAGIAGGLARAGLQVLVSCATNIVLDIGSHENIRRRAGRLNVAGLTTLIAAEGIHLVVDAAHPYATDAHNTARQAAQRSGIPYVAYIRPTEPLEDKGIIGVHGHNDAAKAAFASGKPVLLTTGSRNLAPYINESKRTNIPLIVRVLPERPSIEACRSAGIPEDRIIAARGPFSIEENREAIRRFAIGVLVTKDSGAVGGVKEKIEAAHLEGCAVVVVQRPALSSDKPCFTDAEALLEHITANHWKA